MEPAVRSGTADAPVAPAARGVVSRHALFGRLGLPDAPTASSFSGSRLDHREGQLDAAQRAQVAARLGWSWEQLRAYPYHLWQKLRLYTEHYDAERARRGLR